MIGVKFRGVWGLIRVTTAGNVAVLGKYPTMQYATCVHPPAMESLMGKWLEQASQ